MPDFTALQTLQSSLIRKFRNGSVFVSNTPSVTLPTRLTATTDNKPTALTITDWTDLGLLSEDGAQFESETSTSDTTTWQQVEPARSDVVSKVNTLALQAKETKRATIELYTGKDLSTLIPATGGAVVFDDDTTPSFRYARVLAIGVDDTADGPIYLGRALTHARVTSLGGQSINKGDDGLVYDLTFTGYVDDVLKTSQRWYFEGPGWLAALSRMGFKPAAA